jgi:nicotinamide-nucleotide adenylyltransferase
MPKRYSKAAFIGRFQPFHLGHLEFIQQILSESYEVILIIGSSQANFTPHNPFTAGERIRMIRDSLIESNIRMEKVTMIHIMDDQNNYRWFSNLKSFSPPFTVLYTGNVFIKLLLENENILLREPKFTKKEQYNGSNIRRLLAANDLRWKNLVPKAVTKIIFELNGPERLRKLESSWTDSPFHYF